MRNTKIHFLPALLCGAALFTFACGRGEVANEAPQQLAQTETAAPLVAAEPQTHELQPVPQSVQVEEQAPPVADLSARERELADREAELDARERRLRQTQTQALIQPRPAPSRPAAEQPETVRPEPPRAVTPELAPADPAPEPEPVREEPRTVSVTIPAGAQIDVEFTRRLASNTSSPGDSFRARVNHDLIQDGVVAIPAGSEILGEVTDALPLKRVGGQARLALKFTDLVLPSGKTVPIDASFVQEGRNETRKDAATIGGAAAGGAVLGRILNKGNRSRGSVLGAIIGAAAGTAIASKTPGEEVIIPEGSVVSLRLDDSVRVQTTVSR
ncbi:MAG TPA: hypothetical protein VLB76_15495 [Thermoanaerobaculia bacterium]|jgi:hypothetical protein|nr:hypothetical protein [Thermoanaerobaculia bacterium]